VDVSVPLAGRLSVRQSRRVLVGIPHSAMMCCVSAVLLCGFKLTMLCCCCCCSCCLCVIVHVSSHQVHSLENDKLQIMNELSSQARQKGQTEGEDPRLLLLCCVVPCCDVM
jgi:hypothetical protein